MKTIEVRLTIQIPIGATHFFGGFDDEPSFFKSKHIGFAGIHWFVYRPMSDDWYMTGHTKPNHIKLIDDYVVRGIQ